MMSLILFTVYGAGIFGSKADLLPSRGLSSVKEEVKEEVKKEVQKKVQEAMTKGKRNLQSKIEDKVGKSDCSSCSCGK